MGTLSSPTIWTSALFWQRRRRRVLSVIQVRTQDVMPSHLSEVVVQVLRQYESWIHSGALITVNERDSRVRLLPLTPRT